ncbi:hypothetical protein GOARA_036_01200 [Gordonia araii NBRC 100433]|uniref:DUF4333 domain-containing protein n=1 Tax=Gordonia araii NBRC 100433 TaxID=1073574 RepID=G7H0L3_9ACTN|nr:DUF4333 domain-containing protein [Gordonia araii]GAB09388.1 hypothetical protein GOARA_036_01200 [Gordonia araii NBRC 100433]
MTEPQQPEPGSENNEPNEDVTQSVEQPSSGTPSQSPSGTDSAPADAAPGQPSSPQQPSPQVGQPGQPQQPGPSPFAQPGQAQQPGQPPYTQPQFGQPQQPGQPPQPGQPQFPGQPGPQFAQPGQPPFGQQQPQYPVPPGAGGPHTGQFQQPGQYPQPGQPQFGGPDFAAMGTTGGKSKSLKLALIGAGGILFLGALLAFTAFVAPGWAPKTLSQTGAQDGVRQILTNSYQVKNVKDVNCPSGQRVKQGESFDCDVTVDGSKQKVTVTFVDKKGKFEVGPPRQ